MPDRQRVLATVLVAALITMAIGWLFKSPCLGSWADGRQYNRLCYSDVAALYGSTERGLADGRFPYLEGENEYPVLTGLAMWTAAVPASDYASFFNWNALLLTASALVTAGLLWRIGGRRALLFAVAPTLAVYGLMNWDLLAVVLATAGTYAYLKERDVAAGVLLGLGAAAKLYPGLLLVPFAVGRLRQRRPTEAGRLIGTGAVTWLVINIPFAILAFDRWSEFFRFNAVRPADWDSIWYIAARPFGFVWNPAVVNGLALASFVVAAGALWFGIGRRLTPDRVWLFGFPLLVAFLLTSKVYSPQYGLWLLPWFALALPNLPWFAAFSLADAAVFVTRFEFFARLEGLGTGLPQWTFELAVLIRAAILIGCVVVWARRHAPRETTEQLPALLEVA